jgi:hypothetical protein
VIIICGSQNRQYFPNIISLIEHQSINACGRRMFFLFFSASEGKTALLFRFSSLEKDESQKSKPEHLSVMTGQKKNVIYSLMAFCP